MPEIPRDPRQLARDILAGKVRIEDLQRERQMRAGGGAPPPPRPVARVPLPRPVPPPQKPIPPAQRPIQRGPFQQPPRPVPPLSRQAPPEVRVPPKITVRQTLPVTAEPSAPVRVMQDAPTLEATKAETKARRAGLRLNDLVKSKLALRQGILLAEVLGKPISLRVEM